MSAGLLRSSQFLARRRSASARTTLRLHRQLFVMLYLLFFLLRDGDDLGRRTGTPFRCAPSSGRPSSTSSRSSSAPRQGQHRGRGDPGRARRAHLLVPRRPRSRVVGRAHGDLSLLPAVGTALVWLPVAVYLLATGDTWQGIVLIAWGVLIIGLVDNVMRPVLVGKDIKMPDYVALVSPLGGLAVFA